MFEKLTASTYIKTLSAGRTKPMLVECEAVDASGQSHQVVIKLSGGCDIEEKALIREAIAAFFAVDMNIPVPCPYQVEITDGFVESIPSIEDRERAASSNRTAFGCTYLPGQSIRPSELQITGKRLTQAAQIYAFDHVLGNMDRRVAKPNCLDDGSRFTVIDHEMCFTHMDVLFGDPPQPWHTGNSARSDMHGVERHVFHDAIKGKPLDFNALESSLSSLAHERIDEYSDAIPLEWENRDYIATLVAYMKQVVDNAAPIFTEIRRTLA